MSDLNKVSILLLSLTLSIIFSIFSSIYIIAFLGVIIVITLIQFKNSKLLLIPITVGYLSFTSELFASVRPIIILITTALLIYLFLKKYGFNFFNYPKVPKGLIKFFFLLLITLIISTIFSEFFTTSLIALIRTVFFFAIVYLYYSLTTTDQDIKVLIFSLILVMLMVGIPMIVDLYNLGLQRYLVKSIITENVNLYTSKGYTGMTLLFISFALIVIMFFWKESVNSKFKYLLIFLLIFNVIFLFLANSRGGILAAIIGSGFILFKLERRIFVRSFLVFLSTFLLLYLFVPAINDAINLYLRWETLGDREVYWQMGIDVIKDYGIFGVGPDIFDKFFFNYAPSSTINYFKLGDMALGKPHPHNFFLYFFAENGILGVITSIAFFIIIFWYSVKTIKLSKGGKNFHFLLAISITGIIIGIFFRAFIEITGFLLYGYITRDLPFWIILIMLIRIYQKYEEKQINPVMK